MPRQPRLHVPGGLYHAVLRGNHRQPIFRKDDDRREFENLLAVALTRYGAALYAYCWMTNHVHLAVRIGEAPLGEIMRVLASRYARGHQRRLTTTGHLFERRYHARHVDLDRYLLALVRYIHRNPVRAHLVTEPGAYPWSSHRAYTGEAHAGWLDTDLVLGMLGSTPVAARMAYLDLMSLAPNPADDEAIAVTGPAPGITPAQESAQPRMPGAPARGLEAIAREVATERGMTAAELSSPCRARRLAHARAEVARRALTEGVATLTQVARHFGRAPSTLSGLLRDGVGPEITE